MKKTLITAATALVIGAAAWIVNSSQTAVPTKEIYDDEVIKIGVIMPLSGEKAALGKRLKQGFDLIKQQNRYGKNVELIYRDDKTNTEEIADIATELAETGNIDALITYEAVPAEIVAPIAAKYKIFQFASADNPAFTRYKGNYIFTPNVEEEAQILASAIKKRGYQTAALFSDDDFYNDRFQQAFHKAALTNELEIVFAAQITPETTDYKTLLEDAKVKNPDIYILQLKSPKLEQLVKHLKKTSPKHPFTSAHVFFFSPKRELFDGQFFLGIGTTDNDFKQLFRKNYGRYPEQTAIIAYTAADLMLKTLTTIDDKEQFYDRLKEIANRDKSVLGKLRVKERQINYPPLLQEFKKGKIIPLSE